MNIRVFFDLGLKGLEPIDAFINWDYPVLPRVGEKVGSPLLFISEKFLEEFNTVPALKYVDEAFYDSFGEDSKKRYSQETFYDFLVNYDGDRFVIKEVEWLLIPQEGICPWFHIIPV